MTDPLTEAVARIIDPSSWAVMDSYLADMLRKYKGENAAYDPEQYKHKESMAVAQAAIAAMREQLVPRPDTPPVAKSESPVVSDTAAQLAEAQREIERKEWKP